MRAPFAMLSLLVVLCGGSFLLLARDPGRSTGDEVPDALRETPEFSPEPRDGSGAGREAPDDPEVTAEEENVAGYLEMLGHPQPSSRERAVMALGQIGAAARAALPCLEEIIRSETGRIRFRAMVAVMRIEGSRTYYRKLAEAAANPAGRGRHPAWIPFHDFDPVHAPAILAALELRKRKTKRHAPPPGLTTFLDRFFEDEAAGLSELNDRIAVATRTELAGWFLVVQRIEPLPKAIVPALQQQLVAGGDGERLLVIGLLTSTHNDATALREMMAPFIRSQAEEADPEWRSALLGTLGGLGATDAASVRLLQDGLAAGSVVADGAARSLARLGTEARPAIDELIRTGTARVPGTRSWHLAALVGTKDARIVPFLAKVLRQGNTVEVRFVETKAHGVEGAAALAPVFLERFEGPPNYDIHRLLNAAMRCDPGMTRAETSRLFVAALDDTRPPSRQYALESLRYAKALTPEVAASLARALLEATDVRSSRAVGMAIGAATKIGKDAAPIVPSLLALVHDRRHRYRVVEALTLIDPHAPGCLEVFRRYAIEGRAGQVRHWCVKGIAEIGKPTKEDVAILERVIAAKDQGYRSSESRLATEILSRPEWKILRK